METITDRTLLMLDSVATAIVFFDASKKSVDCNNATLDMFCFDNKEDYLNNFHRFMPPFQANGTPSMEFLESLIEDAVNVGKIKKEIMCQRTDGILMPTEVTLTKVEHEGKHYVTGSFHDLTEIKATIKKTLNVSEIAHMYLSAAPLAMELFNDHYRIIDCNDQALELLGFSEKADYIMRNTPQAPEYLYHEMYTLEQDEQYYLQALREGYVRYEWVFKNKDGVKIPCEITRVRISNPERVFVVSYIHNLSKVRALAEELKKAETIDRENRAKNQFLAQMSHVLRTPLNNIMGLSEIQLHKNFHPEVDETFMQIQRSSYLLLGIINDILDLSNANAGNLGIVSRTIDVPNMITNVANKALLENENGLVRLVLNIDENLPLNLMGDEIRIKQIVNNLLSNAFKHTKSGTVELIFKAISPTLEDDMTIEITVKDTGQGMPPLQVENIFYSERTRFNEQGAIQGIGLGMIITHRLVKMMKGEISVTSELGKGSVFTVLLPLEAIGDTLIGLEKAGKLKNIEIENDDVSQVEILECEPMPYGKVLVVDDVECNLFVAKGMMEAYELTVEVAGSGYEAIEKIQNGNEYDLILMDHMMPGLDGIQSTKIIKEMGCNIPVIVWTANIVSDQENMFDQNGFAGYVAKPLEIKQLDAHLMRLIRDKYPEEARKARAATPPISIPVSTEGVSDELVRHFMRDAKNAITILENLMKLPEFTNDDWRQYTITTHGIKSALANVNEYNHSKAAAMLDEQGRAGNYNAILEKTPNFIKQIKELIIHFEKIINNKATITTTKDPVFLKEQLSKFISACENFDKSGAKKVLKALREKNLNIDDTIDELSTLLLHSDFEEAIKVSQDYTTELSK